ncbi:TatD family hydrolase [Leptolyngbya sp. FACHB-17]|uniref:TatD family hydrolase n=1 Tax=unclassified Leptolyngbya TaxID=2650499 RepID=UPI0016818660|nr:TatD family hydrolase [Leptolyngbya sp. FACHB-17]MBD2082799.1 TatD family hydrolase [Leptolyngbya sp. FACHB-17]
MQLIDTHVHINFDAFKPDLDEIASRWREAGVVRLVHSCVEPSEFDQIRALADRFPELFFAVGLHPLDVEEKWLTDSTSEILTLAQSDQRVVAIGEMGLDFFKAENRDQQIEAFRAQLAIAQQLDLPVIIHCRDAAETMAQVVQQFWQEQGQVKGVMHCWGGTPEETQWFLDLGFYISFSGTVTFKNAKQIHASAQMVPSDRILIETDCPFLAPVPKRGERRNEPSYVQYVARQVAALRDTPIEQFAAQTTQNACQLFGLTVPELAVI